MHACMHACARARARAHCKNKRVILTYLGLSQLQLQLSGLYYTMECVRASLMCVINLYCVYIKTAISLIIGAQSYLILHAYMCSHACVCVCACVHHESTCMQYCVCKKAFHLVHIHFSLYAYTGINVFLSISKDLLNSRNFCAH